MAPAVIRRHPSDTRGVGVIRVSAERQQLAKGYEEQSTKQQGVPTEESSLPGNARQDSKVEESLQNEGSAHE